MPHVLATFALSAYPAGMPEAPPSLTPASDDEIVQSLAFALRFKGRKRVHQGDELMATITAERLAEYLRQAGFVVMKKPPIAAPTTEHMPPSSGAR
jgi:hypothetical protein